MTPERATGVVTLGRLLKWDSWVNRRIEALELKDPLRLIRRVSLDFRYPHDHPAAEYSPDNEPIVLVPLTLLRKRTLIDFSLRDETGAVLPLLTRTQNANVAAAVLAAYAEWKADTAWGGRVEGKRPLEDKPIPEEIFDDLRRIAIEDRGDALRSWEQLDRARNGQVSAAQEWRDAMVTDPAFMALARDLALNFLVLTPLIGRRGQRRVLKYKYEERVEKPVARISARAREYAARWDQWRAARRLRRRPGPVGELIATAELHSVGADPQPCSNIGVTVVPCVGGRIEEPCTFRKKDSGSLTLSLPVGEYLVRPVVPTGLAQLRAVTASVTIDERRESRVDFVFVRGTDGQPRGESRGVEDRQSLVERLGTAIGWRPRRIVVLTPAIGHGGSYHFDVEAPEGLFISRITLRERRASPATRGHGGEARTVASDEDRDHVHLSASAVPQDSSGIVELLLRPRARTVVRPACLSAIFTTCVLFAIARRWPAIGTNAGSVATLLLAVPGGLSAWSARAQEHPWTTERLLGVRLLALAAGLWAFLGALAIVLNRKYSADPDGSATLGPAWGGTELTLYTLFILSGLTAVALGLAWWRIVRLKENS